MENKFVDNLTDFQDHIENYYHCKHKPSKRLPTTEAHYQRPLDEFTKIINKEIKKTHRLTKTQLEILSYIACRTANIYAITIAKKLGRGLNNVVASCESLIRKRYVVRNKNGSYKIDASGKERVLSCKTK
jgi:hypothetical protein